MIMGTKQTKVSKQKREKEEEEEEEEGIKKVLLLGASHTGKSTLFKQLTIPTYESESNPSLRRTIIESCLKLLTELVRQIQNNKDENALNSNAFLELLNKITGSIYEDDYKIPSDDALQISQAWNDHISVYFNKYKNVIPVRLHAEMKKFMSHFIELCDGSLPISREMDLSVFISTTGIIEGRVNNSYTTDDISVVDVAGLRGGRRKWIHCFEGVSCIIFQVSLTEFCEKLQEDENICSMTESLELFSEVVNSRWFVDTPIILLFTKKDLLFDRLCKYPDFTCFDAIPESLKNISQMTSIAEIDLLDSKTDTNNLEGISYEQLQSIPRDVLYNILSFNTATQLCKLSLVNRFMYDLSGSDQVWKQLLHRESEDTMLNHEAIVALHKEKYLDMYNISSEDPIHMKPYKFHYSTSAALPNIFIKFVIDQFKSKISAPNRVLPSYSLNLFEENSVRKFVKVITDVLNGEFKGDN